MLTEVGGSSYPDMKHLTLTPNPQDRLAEVGVTSLLQGLAAVDFRLHTVLDAGSIRCEAFVHQ